MKVFVYGSLKKGFGNNRLLQNSQYLGEAITCDNYTMYSMGSFPSITKEPSYPIKGEVYLIDETTLANLDRLEGYIESRKNNFYDREIISVLLNDNEEKVFVYFGKPTNKTLKEGVWKSSNSW